MSLLDWLRYYFKPPNVSWVCDFAKKHPKHDPHDYPVEAGGDGHPSAFYQYTCWNCGKKFSI